eukprot:15460148-Alexandrium_andersonii.AAC.1
MWQTHHGHCLARVRRNETYRFATLPVGDELKAWYDEVQGIADVDEIEAVCGAVEREAGALQ